MKSHMLILPCMLLLVSCGGSDKTTAQVQEPGISQTWVLISMYETPVTIDTSDNLNKVPQLTINVESMRYSGTDGCNNIFGHIDSISDSFLDFGPSAGTLMACPDLETPRIYVRALEKTRSYTIKDSLLIFRNESEEEVLRFKQAL